MLQSLRQNAPRDNSDGKFLCVDYLFILLSLPAEGALDPMLMFTGTYVPMTSGRGANAFSAREGFARP